MSTNIKEFRKKLNIHAVRTDGGIYYPETECRIAQTTENTEN